MGALAVYLLSRVGTAKSAALIHLAGSSSRVQRLAMILGGLDPGLPVIVLPAWDCLPYDRAAPSRSVMGLRMAAFRALTEAPGGPCILLATPDALLQRIPPRAVWWQQHVILSMGDSIDTDKIGPLLMQKGYFLDDRVDEPGEFAVRGRVIDIFPSAADAPVRLEHDSGRVVSIRGFDPVSQRSSREMERVILQPASELAIPKKGDPTIDERGARSADGPLGAIEHRLPDFYPDMETLFDHLEQAPLVLEREAEKRVDSFLAQVADAYASRKALVSVGGGKTHPPPKPERLYLTKSEWQAQLAARQVLRLSESRSSSAVVPRFATSRNAAREFAAYLEDRLDAGHQIVLTAASARDLLILMRRAERATGDAPKRVDAWSDIGKGMPKLLALEVPIDQGFVLDHPMVTVIAAPDLLGSRAESPATMEVAVSPALSLAEPEFRLGDVAVHIEHGLGIIEGIETIAAAGTDPCDAICLRYADDAKLIVPVDEIGKIWRYGSEPESVSLDRLEGNSWEKRRGKVLAEIDRTAAELVALAKARQEAVAPVLAPKQPEYERVISRFPFDLTRDQADAVECVLKDLASGRPMDRVVCGDVGFGKTEVAIRAAAAVAGNGKQVALIAPTTVLVRQHLRNFQRRFAGTDVEIVQLSRLMTPVEARQAKQRLASGDAQIVIGTQALLGKGVRFADLGLLIVDEEQRFGAKQKAKIRSFAAGLHVLTLTATPIPRTLQSALIGLQDLSVIATPPARRQPIHTFLTPFDPTTVRAALRRERQRGGQSFFVCPRIEDIEPMAERLATLVPELDILPAHGKMPAEALDDVMIRFAEGDGDILLATNIIENGLDLPQANTMLIWHAHRFGLAQLHQLRGRVGRSARRAVAYLLTDPDAKLPRATEKRLRTLESLDRLGAGFAISARDLDLRGAGDLIGEEQAGHVKLIGLELYQHLLRRALAAARGDKLEDEWSPDVNLGITGRIPEDYVGEPEVKLNIYARLDRLDSEDAIQEFTAEIEDRFGPLPPEVEQLIQMRGITAYCRNHDIARLDGGPQAIAVTFRARKFASTRLQSLVDSSAGRLRWHNERLLLSKPSQTPEERLKRVWELFEVLPDE
jgi:transcription-repair coupling factor (superfamily II helicase)